MALGILSQNFGMFGDGWVKKDNVNVVMRFHITSYSSSAAINVRR